MIKKFWRQKNKKNYSIFGANDQSVKRERYHIKQLAKSQWAIVLLPVCVLAIGFVAYRSFADSNVSKFTASGDTYVAQESPSTNYNSRPNILVRGGTQAHATAYFQFNLSGVSGKKVESAKLRIKTDSEESKNVGNLHILSSAPKPYSELNWNNRPSLSGATKVGSLTTVKKYTWYEIPLTYANWKDGTVHLAFDGGNVYDAANFRSINTSEKPQLILTYASPTETSLKPLVNLTSNISSVNSGGIATLSWNSLYTSSCSASGAWSGVKPAGGTENTAPITTNSTYTLNCSGPGGSSTTSVSVSVNAQPVNTTPTTGTGSTTTSLRKPFIPVGMWNVNDQNLKNGGWVYGVRVVMNQDTNLYRFFSGFNLEGVDFDGSGNSFTVGSRSGYANGNGGTILARLTEVKTDGTPDFSKVLAQETFNPVDRYKQTKAAYGISAITQHIYINTNNVQLKAGKTYTMTFQNVHSNPASNFVSTNSPTVRNSFSGPNGRNNLDPNATGAIAGLDPREVAMWSANSGASWLFGREVGTGYYAGSSSSDDGTRLPWYGWQTSSSAKPQSNQPYYAYTGKGNYVLRAKNAKKKVTVTQAGGYAPIGSAVGVVTVKNVTTGAVSKTSSSLGEGIVYGALESPIVVDVGHELEIRHSGTVTKQEGDQFLVQLYGLGTGDWALTTDGHGADVAQLFVLPWPYYR